MKHVIVTGGAGFVGSHLCDELLSRGYAVTAIDNLITGREGNIEAAKRNDHFAFLNWDVCQPLDESRIKLLPQHGLHAVLHFACPASPTDFDRIPFEILAVDSIGTQHSVSWALKHHSRYVVASTSEVYGDPAVHPQTESYFGNVNPVGPRACYDEAKRFAEAYVSTAIRHKNLNGGIVRIFNTYGPRMRLDDGRIVPQLCSEAMKGQALTIHGDGSQTRSFCFVSDLVDGIIRLMESKEHDPINIGNPVEHTVLEFAEQTLKLVGSKSALKKIPARPDDPRRRCPDITRARKLLGWEPRVSLVDGLQKTIDHFRLEMGSARPS